MRVRRRRGGRSCFLDEFLFRYGRLVAFGWRWVGRGYSEVSGVNGAFCGSKGRRGMDIKVIRDFKFQPVSTTKDVFSESFERKQPKI